METSFVMDPLQTPKSTWTAAKSLSTAAGTPSSGLHLKKRIKVGSVMTPTSATTTTTITTQRTALNNQDENLKPSLFNAADERNTPMSPPRFEGHLMTSSKKLAPDTVTSAKQLPSAIRRAPAAGGPPLLFSNSHHHHHHAKTTTGGRSKNASLALLKRSNHILERLLSERKSKERTLESKLVELNVRLKKQKDRSLKRVLHTFSSSLFLLIAGLLLYYNWKMFSPHFDAIVMGFLVASLLRDVLFTPTLARVEAGTRLLRQWGFPLRGGLDPKTLVAGVLTVSFSTLVCLPLLLAVKSSMNEVDLLAKSSLELLSNQERFDAWMEARIYRFTPAAVREGMAEMDLLSRLTAVLKQTATEHSNVLALGLISNFSNLLWAFGVFCATLFSLLQIDAENVYHHLAKLSPLSASDNQDVYSTIKTCAYQVFACSASVGLAHALTTYLALTLAGSPVTILPALLSSCLAVAPFLGNFVVWVPFVAGFYAADMPYSACLVAALECFVTFVVDPVIVRRYPASANFFGLPVVAGLFAFGLFGVVYGPLLVGLSMSFAQIYSRYVSSLCDVDLDEGEGGEGEDLDVSGMNVTNDTVVLDDFSRFIVAAASGNNNQNLNASFASVAAGSATTTATTTNIRKFGEMMDDQPHHQSNTSFTFEMPEF